MHNRHRHFLTPELPPLLKRVARRGTIADLGCGDGALIWALAQDGRLGDVTYAVDLAEERVRIASTVAPGVQGVVASATSTPLATSSVDGVIVSQVIEHLPDDGLLASEVARILRPGGWWYIGSVLRAPRAWWVYKQDGRRLLDPTHVREYASREEFQAAIGHPELLLTDLVVSPFRFPLVDLVARGAAVLGLINNETLVRLYARHPALARLRRLTVRPPGYSRIEAAGSTRDSSD